MSDTPETVEDFAAGMLNGVMICLLSLAFPVLLAWQVVATWTTWTADLRSVLVWESLFGFTLLIGSIQFFGVGARLFWRNARALRRRRRSSPTL